MNFTCPYCNHHSTIVGLDSQYSWEHIYMNKTEIGDIGFGILTIRCPNKDCNKLFLKTRLTNSFMNLGSHKEGYLVKEWQLLPESSAKIFPDYVPEVITEDYLEACRIRDLSPKASATLARRCLQGMIRDFWKISKTTLKEEIDDLKNLVDNTTWDAIDSIRRVGNIGAHMERDINLIIDVESNEAQLLIELIEQLVDDWYVQRHNREERMQKVKKMAEDKKQQNNK